MDGRPVTIVADGLEIAVTLSPWSLFTLRRVLRSMGPSLAPVLDRGHFRLILRAGRLGVHEVSPNPSRLARLLMTRA